jgi:trigger factor
MQVTRKDISETKINLSIVAEASELSSLKKHVITHFQAKTKVAGFRMGKAPLNVIEKHVDPAALQSEFLDEAINNLYQNAVNNEKIKAFGHPSISIKKFVPFTDLEFDAEVEILGKIKLADYKKIKKNLSKVEVTTKDVNEVLDNLRQRSASKEAVKRSAKLGDEAIIDFKGVDSAKKPIQGADGDDYPLTLGSNAFIPGFEENIVGMKAGDEKTFDLTFPKDYGVKTLANKKVSFTVNVKTVNKLTEPKLDDEFATTVGPFKTLADLKTDIKKQLSVEKQSQANRQLENELILEIVEGSKLSLPKSLVEEQMERLKGEVRQNLNYRGQTWQEMLDAEGVTSEEYDKQQLLPEAERRVKTGLVLAEISVQEKLEITPDELEERMQILNKQYSDAQMQAELAKPESRQEIASRLLTEKTVDTLVKLVTSK